MSVTAAQLAEALAMRDRLRAEATRLRAFCRSSNYQGDRAACAATADAIDVTIANAEALPSARPPGGGLLYRARQGDADALRRWNDIASRVLGVAPSTERDLRDSTVTDVMRRVAEDARDAALEVGMGFGAGLGLVAVAAGVWFVVVPMLRARGARV